jgi:hypothetical protein
LKAGIPNHKGQTGIPIGLRRYPYAYPDLEQAVYSRQYLLEIQLLNLRGAMLLNTIILATSTEMKHIVPE